MENTGSPQISLDALSQKIQSLELKLEQQELKLEQQRTQIIELREQINKQPSLSANDIIKIRDADARRAKGL